MDASERVDRVMSAAFSIDIEECAGTMLRLFAEYPIHHLPVVSGRRVVGMLSSADVMKLEALRPKTGMPSNEYLSQVGVAALMSRSVITIRPHELLIDAAHLMASHGIHALPVVDSQEELLGIVTTTDIMTATLQQVAQRPTVPSTPAEVRPCEIVLGGPEFDQAIAAAKTAVAAGQDPQGVATALLYLQKRVILLERFLQIADHYLRDSRLESLPVELRKAIADVKPGTMT
jgi:signal-transduction protein with cAMP-binding, CBS, and nucleotidyltransferase domain